LTRRAGPKHRAVQAVPKPALISIEDDLEKKVKRQHWLKGRLYIVEDVEAEVCKECGERYFHATTLDAIDKCLSTEHPVKAHLDVEVVNFSQQLA